MVTKSNETLRFLTWNINGNRSSSLSPERVAALAAALAEERPDVVCLQEVHLNGFAEVRDQLEKIGLKHIVFSDPQRDRPRHGEVVASRHEMRKADDSWTRAVPYPELFAHAIVKLHDVDVHVVSVHIPNGSANGWDKIRHFDVLHEYLATARHQPHVVAGDFNEPRSFPIDALAITFGHERLGSGELAVDGDLTRPTQTRVRAAETFPRAQWIEGVRRVLDSRAQGALEHAYLKRHGRAEPIVTHQTRPRAGKPRTQANDRFFDHILTSPHFEIDGAGFRHDWRENGLSDHSAAWATVRLLA